MWVHTTKAIVSIIRHTEFEYSSIGFVKLAISYVSSEPQTLQDQAPSTT